MKSRQLLVFLGALVALSGCAATALPPAQSNDKVATATPPSAAAPGTGVPGVTEPLPDARQEVPAAAVPAGVPLTPAEVSEDFDKLRAALAKEVPESRGATAGADWIKQARALLAKSGQSIDRPQLIVVVDRSPKVQALRIILARPGDAKGDAPWEVLGGTHVSTGQTGRFDHYVTPVGVFPHTDAILDFRAEGTFNENHIRGYGLKGMRIWDFGWQTASKGWLAGQQGPMRLLMHATDPANLEHRIGARASSGCVRIPANLNVFLDRHGVLDYDYERMAKEERRFRWILRPDRDPTPLAGTLMMVFDSSDKGT
jgi:hypothetical protein